MDAVHDIDRLPAVRPKRRPLVHIPPPIVLKVEEPDTRPILCQQEARLESLLPGKRTRKGGGRITINIRESPPQQGFVLPESFFAGDPKEVLSRYQLEVEKHHAVFEICHRVLEPLLARGVPSTDKIFGVYIYTTAHCDFKKCECGIDCTMNTVTKWLPVVYALLVKELRDLHLAAAGTEAMATE